MEGKRSEFGRRRLGRTGAPFSGPAEFDDEQNEARARHLGLGVAWGASVGLALGAGIGVALDNLALGVGVGLSMGAGIGIALGAARGDKQAKAAAESSHPKGDHGA